MANKLFELGFVLKAVDHLSSTLRKIETQMEAVNAAAAAPWREFAGNLAIAGGAVMAGATEFPLKHAIARGGELEDHMAWLAIAIGNVPNKARRLDQPEKFVKQQSIASGYDIKQLTKALYQGLSSFLSMTPAMAVSVEAAKVGDRSGDLTDTTSLAALPARGLSGETAREGLLEIITQMSRASKRLAFDTFAGPNRQGIDSLKTLQGIHRQFGAISKHNDIAAAFEEAFGARAEFIGALLAPVISAIRHGGVARIPQRFEWGVNLLRTLAGRLLARSEQASLRAALKTFAVGIWSGITWPICALEHQGRVILDHLKMHSPPKQGPLRDLRRVRMVETIAQAIQPAPMLAAIRRVAAVAAVTMPMMIGGAAMPAASAISRPFRGATFADSLATASQARPMSGAVVLNYAPHVEVHAPGGDAATLEKAVMEALDKNRREVYRMLEQVAGRRERTRY